MSSAATTTETFDLLIVGGGAFGLGTAAEAAGRGRRVAVIERGPLPNPVAASYGPSRKIRSTYTEPHYAALAREAMTAWRQIERETGAELYLPVGNLAFSTLDDQPHLDHRGVLAPDVLRQHAEREAHQRAGQDRHREHESLLSRVEPEGLADERAHRAVQHPDREAEVEVEERSEQRRPVAGLQEGLGA